MLSRFEEVVILIDGYSKKMDILEYLFQINSSKIKILLSERTSKHENNRSWLREKSKNSIFDNNILEYSIDQLDDNEVSNLSKIIDNLGIWGILAGKSDFGKQLYITEKNNINFSYTLLKLFNAPQIKEKISELLQHLFGDIKIKNIIFAICLLEIMDISPKRSLISELAGNDDIYKLELEENSNFREIFRLKSNTVTTKSSVFALNLLNNHFASPYITDTCLKIACHFNKIQDYGFVQKEIFKSLIRFSFVEKILPEKNKKNSLVKYYEELKIQINWLKGSPQYWLQYAMARITLKQLDMAQQYLDQAYAIANNKPNYDTSYLDPQQARLYLLEALKETEQAKVFNFFKNADNLLHPLDNNSYKFRQVIAYEEIYSQKYDIFSAKNKVSFEYSCNRMLFSLKSSEGLNGDSILQKCEISLNKILNSIKDKRKNKHL